MDLEEQFSIEHVLFQTRKCRTCGVTKDLIDGFYGRMNFDKISQIEQRTVFEYGGPCNKHCLPKVQ